MKKRLAHTVWECKYHIVWVPKNRRKVVYDKLKRDIGRILGKLPSKLNASKNDSIMLKFFN